ncbi:MAG: TGS domain-containing protein, partial [Planctomycetaceae bacterium]|nr:TGS domain-containing protein [Planctomycetaceae bacterium]
MLTVSLPDGSTREYSESITPGQIAAEIGPGLAKAALAAAVDDTIVGLDFVIDDGQSVALRILTKKDPEALGVMRHSAAHIMA